MNNKMMRSIAWTYMDKMHPSKEATPEEKAMMRESVKAANKKIDQANKNNIQSMRKSSGLLYGV